MPVLKVRTAYRNARVFPAFTTFTAFAALATFTIFTTFTVSREIL